MTLFEKMQSAETVEELADMIVEAYNSPCQLCCEYGNGNECCSGECSEGIAITMKAEM